MFKKTYFLMVTVAILLVSPIIAAQIPVSWDGGGDGSSWEDPLNWNPDIVPDNNGTQTFAVTIDGEFLIILSESHTIDQLDCYGELNLENFDCGTLFGPIVNHGDLEVTEMDLWGGITNTSGSVLEGIELGITGELSIESGAVVIPHKAGDEGIEVEDGNIQNFGRIYVVPSGEINTDNYLENSGLLDMWGGVCKCDLNLVNFEGGTIRGFGLVHSDTGITNKGLIFSLGGSLVLRTNGLLSNEGHFYNTSSTSLNVVHYEPQSDANNAGVIEVNTGGGVAFDCNLANEPNGIITLLGGTIGALNINQKAGAVFEGDGKISGNLLIQTNAHIALTGPTEIYGDVQVDANAVLDINDGTTLIKGHCTCNNGMIHLKGGWLIPQGGLTNNNCNIIWEPGLYNNIADFNLDGKVDFHDFSNFADTWLWQTQW
jgi:hypothetical protein